MNPLKKSSALEKAPQNSGPKLTLVGPYVAHNFGDDLIGSVIVKHCRKLFGADVCVPSLESENCVWIGARGERLWHKDLLKSDGLVIGGGGILGQAAHSSQHRYLKTAFKASMMARARKIPYCVTGVGAGYIPDSLNRFFCQQICRSACRVGVRDLVSGQALVSMDVPESKIICGADVALCWPGIHESVTPKQNGRIGFQFDAKNYSVFQKNPYQKEISAILAKFARDRHEEILFVSNGSHETQIARGLAVPVTSLKYRNLPEFLTHFAGIRVMLSSHLHLNISAYAAGIPCFALYVQEKTKRFFEQIGHPDRSVALENATPDQVSDLLERVTEAKWKTDDSKKLMELQSQAQSLLQVPESLFR